MSFRFINGKPDLAPKQEALVKLCHQKNGQKKIILMSGMRKSGKTAAGIVAIIDHLWNVNGASVLILCKTQGEGATSGVWNEITEQVLPVFIAQDFGMKWAPKGSSFPWKNGGEPRIHGATKKMMCAVINKFGNEAIMKHNPENGEFVMPPGGISELEMDSLDDEREIDKYKSRYLSMIYWSEAAEFYERKSFSTLLLALRGFNRPDDEYVFLIDCNPASTGQSHFLYHIFYELRISDKPSDDEKIYQKWLHLTHWTMDDNPYVSDNEKAVLRSEWSYSPSLYSRFALGEWVRVVENGLFTRQFSRASHVVGDLNDREPEIIIPTEGCSELIMSFDAGGSNPSMYFLEKLILHQEKQDTSVFNVIDELAFIDEQISVEEFTILTCKRMDFWEKEVGNKLKWVCWADRSALDFKESIANRSVSDEIFAVSNGRIKLVGVDKGRGSVGNRIRLIRKLLVQGRIKISGARCPKLIECFENANISKTPDSIPVQSRYKHAMDSLGYGLTAECWQEIQDSIYAIRTAKQSFNGSGLVSIRM
jgi:hypothetical protein